MPKNVRTVINLTPDAVATIARRARSPKKKGEFVSRAVLLYAQWLDGSPPGDSDDLGLLEQIRQQLSRIEQKTTLVVEGKR